MARRKPSKARPLKPPPRAAARGLDRNVLIAAVAAAVIVTGLIVASLALRKDDSGSGAAPSTVPGEIETLFQGIPQDRTVLGSPSAKVTLIQFEDLQCPVCRRYQSEALPGVVEEYVRPGKIKVRFAGISFIGQDSVKALHYALAAGAQGKLWQYADLLYANQGGENSGWVTDALLERIADDLGLQWEKLRADAAGPAVTQQASSMMAEAQQRKVQGTPWFYVQVGDAEPYEVRPGSFAMDEFRGILDDALSG
jgi:protein-disulfide isomerase